MVQDDHATVEYVYSIPPSLKEHLLGRALWVS
jgi:hypothetical protein